MYKYTKFKLIPKFLIFVLKRFEFSELYLTYNKIYDYFEFPDILDMSKYLETNNNTNINCKYNLYGVIIHKGFFYSGHYYYILNDIYNNVWIKFDDSKVDIIDEKEAKNQFFGSKNIGNNLENIPTSYLLIYKKIDYTNAEKANYNNIKELIEVVSNNEKKENIIDINGNNDIMCEKTYNNNKEKILTEDFSDNEDMDNSKNFSFSDEDSISEKRSSELSNINENNNFDKFLEEFHKLNMCCDTSLNKVYKEETNESKAEDENLLQKNKFFNKREGKDILHILKNNKPHKRKSDGMDANNDDINFGKKKGIKYPKKYPK